MAQLSTENKTKLAIALQADYRVDAHPVMAKLRKDGLDDYWDIIELVAADLTLDQIAANQVEQNLWLLRTVPVFSFGHILQFLRTAINSQNIDMTVMAVTRLSRIDPLVIAGKARNVKFLLRHAEKTLGKLPEIEREVAQLMRISDSEIDYVFPEV